MPLFVFSLRVRVSPASESLRCRFFQRASLASLQAKTTFVRYNNRVSFVCIILTCLEILCNIFHIIRKARK